MLDDLFIALGWKVDTASADKAKATAKSVEKTVTDVDKAMEAAAKRQAASIASFAKSAVSIGVAVEAAALAVHAAVLRMAQGMDTLNFTSQRTGASVRSIQAIGYAASQMGSSVEAGISSLENFARTLRQSPGSYSLLERLGIKTTDANGARRSADQLFQEFGKALKSKPGYLQDQYLADFGVDERTGRAILNGLDRFTAEYNDKLRRAGLDPEKAASDGAALQRTFGSIAASIQIIGQKVASNLFQGEGNAFQKFMDFLDANGDKIASVISHMAQVVLELAEALLKLITSEEARKWFDSLLSAFGDVDKETGKFTANVDKMKVALGILAGFVATTWVSKLLSAFGLVGSGWGGLLAKLGLAGLGVSGAAVATAIGADAAVPNADKPGVTNNWDDEASGAAGGAGMWGAIKRGAGAVGRALGIGGGGGGKLAGNPGIGGWWTKERQQHAIDTLTQGGVSELGARALVARWSAVEAAGGPTSVNPRSGAFGIAQWLSRDRLNGIRGNTDYDAQLAYVLKELHSTEGRALRQLNSATTDQEAAIGASMYERAENYNGRTGVDDFTGTTARAMAKIVGGKGGMKPAEIVPKALGPTLGSGVPTFSLPSTPPPSMPGKSVNINIQQGDTTVSGVSDPHRAAEHVGTVAGYRNSDLIRNLRGSLA